MADPAAGSPRPDAIRRVNAALRAAYGRPPRPGLGDPLDALIGTLLSQNTTAANSRAAFAELKRRFPSWQACLGAPAEAVVRAVRSAGLAQLRGPRIQAILARVQEDQGVLSLDVLHRMPSDEAMAYLRTFPGVGPKTAACVLLFACRRQVFPVDTHVARIARRLGWVPESASAEAVQDRLAPLVPASLRYELHVNLIAHGRAVCRPSSPGCAACPILGQCPTGGRGEAPPDRGRRPAR